MARTSCSPSSAQRGASHAASCRRLSYIATVCQGEAVSCSPSPDRRRSMRIGAVSSLMLLWQTLALAVIEACHCL